MDPRTQAALVDRFLELEAQDATLLAEGVLRLPADAYLSPERFERERERLFRRRPVVVATSADLREPGQYLTCESGDIPIVVVRARDGAVRGYVNACRHRANPVARGCGVARRRFTCGFHGWSYSTDDGSLVAQPRSCGGFDHLNARELSLRSVPVAEGHGLIAVRPEGEAPIDLDELLQGLGPELDGFDLAGYHVHSRTRSVWQCNWKLLIDTFLESYHVAVLHGSQLGDQPGHRMLYETFGPNMRIPVPGPDLYEQRELPPPERRLVGKATVQHFLHPNVFVNHVFDYFVMWRFVPLAVDRTLALLTRYWPTPPEDEALRERLDRRFAWQARFTLEEDYPISEAIHRNLASGAVRETIIGRNEPAVIHFHRGLAAQLGAPAP